MKRAFLLVITLAVVGCAKKEDTISENVTGTHNATLIVTLEHSQWIDTAIATSRVNNASVGLYTTLQNALNDTDPKHSAATNASGQTTLYNLEDSKYYVLIQHPLYGDAVDSVKTPANSVLHWYKQI